jgi:ABC-type glycerol-3-phosphate transport system substrate-binding protein
MITGCHESVTPPEKQQGSSGQNKPVVMRVLVVDDEPWAAALEEQWKARSSGEELEVKRVASSDLLEQKRVGCEVIVFPPRLMGDLIEREWIQPLPESMVTTNSSETTEESPVPVEDWFPVVRQGEVSWGRRIYAVPLGSPTFMLLYRTDIFKKLSLEVPATWQEYRQLAEKLASRESLGDLAPAADAAWYGTLEPYQGEWAETLLLARTAAAVRSDNQRFTLFDTNRMSPRIATEPFVQAAEEMLAITKLNSSPALLSPAEVNAKFFAGECAMAISWVSPESSWGKLAVGVAELPGYRETYSFQDQQWRKTPENRVNRATLCNISGRIAAVTKEARQAKAAFRALSWLTKDDTLKSLGPVGERATPFAKTQLIATDMWLPDEVAENFIESYNAVLENSQSRNEWMSVPRLPRQQRYSNALQVALEKMLREEITAPVALEMVEKEWTALQADQSEHLLRRLYQKSCGED